MILIVENVNINDISLCHNDKERECFHLHVYICIIFLGGF